MAAIGDVARQTQLKIPTIRFYEAEGLLAPPPRGPNGRRQYGEAEIRRLTFMRQAREIGFALSDVRSLLNLIDYPEQSCAELGAIARRHLAAVQERILQLNRLRKELARVARSCAGERSPGGCHFIEALTGSAHFAHQQGEKRSLSNATRGYAAPQQATGGNAGKVSQEPRTFAYDEMRRLIERNPEFEKLFVARGLRHPQPEVRWRKKP